MNEEVVERLSDLKARVDRRLPGPLRAGIVSLYVQTRWGLDAVDRAADHDGWDRYHDAGVLALLGLQVAVVGLFALAARTALSGAMDPTPANDPVNALAIPGVNEFMPLAAGLYVALALAVVTGVHELGHAIACRREDVRIEGWGVVFLLGVVPIAGYVMPDEDELDAASPRARSRVFSAGIANNLVLTAVALAGLLAPVTASPGAAYATYFGWAVTGGTPPTAAAIAALGPTSNLLFWTAFLSANVAVLNALPVGFMDGGRVLRLVVDRWSDRLSVPRRASLVAVRAVGVCTSLMVVAAVFGPHVR